jgi:hypothetical protein
MVASTLITDYLGVGTHAARPATPNIPTGGTALYYETDTTNTFAWSGSAWVQINAAGGGLTAPALVQDGVAASATVQSVTLGAAPTNGNLLVALVMGASASKNTGWQLLYASDAGGVHSSNCFIKRCGAGESATQTPILSAVSGTIAMFELSNACVAGPNFNDGSSTTLTLNADAYGTGGFLIGAVCNESSNTLPASITGVTTGASVAGTVNSIELFTKAAPTKGVATNAIVTTFAASTNIRMWSQYVGAG